MAIGTRVTADHSGRSEWPATAVLQYLQHHDVLGEFARESLTIRVRRGLSSSDVIDVLTGLFTP